jgi:uncharacterized DUF497 family protein
MAIEIQWDPRKNTSNKRKHGVSFEEASTVLYDENAVEFYDEDGSETEDRFLLLGVSHRLRILMACDCVREGDSIRIISARKATSTEAKEYHQ